MKKKIFFTLSRYLTFVLKFIQALYIAKYLGPSGLAIYGFAQLVALYISFLHFGIPLSIHTMLSVSKKEDSIKTQTYISDAFSFLLLAAIVFCIVGGLITFILPNLFEKFQFAKYGVLSVVIGVNLIIVQFFANVYQVYGQYIRIALNELISVVILFCVVFLYRNSPDNLLQNILTMSALTIFVNLLFFLYKPPFKIIFSLRTDVLHTLMKLGLPMLVSTVGFYLITFSVRTISNYKYTLYEIGLFTFALNIANAIMMGLNAIGWTYYSTILANTCEGISSAYKYVQKVNRIFNFVLCATVFSGILCFPLLFYFMPAYKEFHNGICILLISQIFMSMSFGYSSLLVAQKEQNSMAVISFITLAFAIAVSILVCILNLPFLYQTVVILASMFFYSLQICYRGAKVCEEGFVKIFFGEVLNFKIVIPVLLWLFCILADIGFSGRLGATLIFFLISHRDIGYCISLLKDFKKEN